MRIGIGFDAHRFAKGRRLVIGSVEIPSERGLAGHSDADVLLHAICDALLGALALGDIGAHFPDTDRKFKDIDSGELLKRVRGMIEARGYEVANVDATVVAEAPKIAPYVEKMRIGISNVLGCDTGSVGVKATTTEEMGFCGRGEGIAAMAVALLKRCEV